MAVAHVMGRTRSHCSRRGVGAVVVGPNQRIVSTGYNGSPAGYETTGNCASWCPRATSQNPSAAYTDCLSVHAEVNALIYADRRLYEGGTLYVTSTVCWDCAKIVANSGIKRVVMHVDSERDIHREPERTVQFMRDCGLEVING